MKELNTHKMVQVLREFLSERLGREISTDEAYVALEALEKAYDNGSLTIQK